MIKQQILSNNFINKEQEKVIKLYHSIGMREMNSHFSKKDFTNYQRFSLLILYVKENKSLRQFCESLKDSKWVNYLQLKKIPKKSTLNSWFGFFDLSKIKKLIQNFIFENKIFAIDGTGLDKSIKSSYYQKRLNEFGFKTKSNYNKLDIICETKTGLIYDFNCLVKQKHDSYVGKKLIKKFKLKNKIILGDKGYNDFIFEDLVGKSNHFISPPKKNEGKSHKRFKAKRKRDLFSKFENVYPLRNNVESVISSLKRVEFKHLKMKRRKIEITWKILNYNIRKSIFFFFILLEISYSPNKKFPNFGKVTQN